MLSTVSNVGVVLNLFTRAQPEWGVTELAREMGLPKSNVHALLVSMVDIGLLARTSRNRYRLGWHLLVLSERMQRGLGLQDHARVEMRALADRLRETVLLAVAARDRVLYVARAEGSHPTVRIAGVRVGAELPLYCTAVGKVFLADQSRDEAIQSLATTTFEPRTAETITQIDTLLASLERVRREGVAYDLRECVPDACCVAAPIRDIGGNVTAALSVSLPAYRFESSADEVRREVIAAAARITDQLIDAHPAHQPAHQPVAATA